MQWPDPIPGSWTSRKEPCIKKAFEKAIDGLEGYAYNPIALIATQVVAGTNYCILCRDEVVVPDATPVYELVYIYENLDGNASITGSKVLCGGEQLPGGYTANDGETELDKNADVKAIFDQAFEGLVGGSFESVAYLGSQVVAGTNYLALFRETPAVLNPTPSFVLVTAYEDLNGKIELSDITDLDIGTMDDDTSASETASSEVESVSSN